MKNKYNYDVAVVTAVVVETEGIKKRFENWEKKVFPNDTKTDYYITTFNSGGKERKIVTAQQTQMGMTACAILCSKVIEHFRPQYLIMTGIAAGIKSGGGKQIYGDIIVPDVIWDYSTGKFVGQDEADIQFGDVGFLPRPSFLRLDDELRLKIKRISERKDFDFKVHIGPMACGSSVVANEQFVSQRVHSLMPDTEGLDMESYGVFFSCDNCTQPAPKALVVKSICDYANSEKSDQFQRFAAYTSSEFTRQLITEELEYEDG